MVAGPSFTIRNGGRGAASPGVPAIPGAHPLLGIANAPVTSSPVLTTSIGDIADAGT